MSLIGLLLRFLFVMVQFCSVSALQVPASQSQLGFAAVAPLADSSSASWTFDANPPPAISPHRWGEARHPGPDDAPVFQVGFSNPSGLRNKEEIALTLGEGVFSFSETQLSAVTQKTCAARLHYGAVQQNRHVRVHFGAAVAPRSTSSWAGGWSGVATISDHPSQEVQLPYGEERACGRVLVTRHFLGVHSLLNGVVYGYPHGPTWPQSKALTTRLLELLTTEIVLGSQGPRVIGGDMNIDSFGLPIFDYWRSLGWQSAQDLAFERWQQPKSFTCKHSTERDLLWLSPEAAAACQWVDIADVFADHSTVTAGLAFSRSVPMQLVWPRPSKIQYEQLDLQGLQHVAAPDWDDTSPVDAQWAFWATSFEDSLDGSALQHPSGQLPRSQRGRLQRTAPITRPAQSRILRPSRPSEVFLRNAFWGRKCKPGFVNFGASRVM
eukprot:s55_g20.t1